MTRKRAGFILMAVAAAACGDGASPAGPEADVPAGLYSLITVNGRRLPFTVFSNGAVRVEIRGRRMHLATNGSYTDELDTAFHEGGGVALATTTRGGTWVLRDGFVTLTYDERAPLVASLRNGTLSFTDGDMIFRLEK